MDSPRILLWRVCTRGKDGMGGGIDLGVGETMGEMRSGVVTAAKNTDNYKTEYFSE